MADGVAVHVELPAEMREQEKTRLEKEIAKLEAEREKLAAKLSNESFTSKAPPAVIEKERARLDQLQGETGQLQQKLETLRAAR